MVNNESNSSSSNEGNNLNNSDEEGEEINNNNNKQHLREHQEFQQQRFMMSDNMDDYEDDNHLYNNNNNNQQFSTFNMQQPPNPPSTTTSKPQVNKSQSSGSSSLSNQAFQRNTYDNNQLPTSLPNVSSKAKGLSAAKKRRRFTAEEDRKIKEGIAKYKKDHGGNNIDWDGVTKLAGIDRTKDQIRSRYMRMKKDSDDVPGSSSSSSKNIQNSSSNQSNVEMHQQNSNNEIIEPMNTDMNQTMESSTKKQKTLPQMFANNQSGLVNTASNGSNGIVNANSGSNHQQQYVNTNGGVSSSSNAERMFIHGGSNSNSMFSDASNSNSLSFGANNIGNVGNTNSNNSTMHSIGAIITNNNSNSKISNNNNEMITSSQQQQYIRNLQSEIEQLRSTMNQKDKQLEFLETKAKGLDSDVIQLKNILQDYENKGMSKDKRFREILIQLLREKAERERQEDKRKVNEKSITIGTITYQKGLDVYEVWQDGTQFQQLKECYNSIISERDKLEKLKKNIQKQRQQLRKEQTNHQNSNDVDYLRRLEEQMNDLNEQEEAVKISLNQLKKEEAQNLAEQEKLLIEKSIQIREIKRIRDQERSMFKNYPIIGHQKYIPTTSEGPGIPQINGQQPPPGNHHEYFLMKMLGKGGFSEVYKAYDLTEFKVVACKIHQLNPNWKEHRKENYIKHVLRECQINQSINHDKLIKMYDTFVFDNNTFVTVLEYCEGSDLDLYIKKHQRIPEREAKNIIAQVFSGLNYLAQQKQKIIHYDLKPANILFDKDGNIKITDFGLSKIMEEEDKDIELTSQGAGTYWYLPPECFHNPSGEGPPPKISNKVDVWSAGVIFYQMLYGCKPFGNNLSQQKILSEGTIINATQVSFPDKPHVSEEAKEFIQKCLTHDMNKRPDVKALYSDSYLRGSAPTSKSSSKKKEKESNSRDNSNSGPVSFHSFMQ